MRRRGSGLPVSEDSHGHDGPSHKSYHSPVNKELIHTSTFSCIMNLYRRIEKVQTDDSTDGQFHNPGFEYLKLIYLMKDTQANDSPGNTSPHFFPLMALQSACHAIEGYVDLVEKYIDPARDESDHEIVSIKERVARIFKKTGTPIDFKNGVWKDALTLLDTAGLIKKNPAEFKNAHDTEIPEIYRAVATKYPIHLSLAIAEQAVEALLACSKRSLPRSK